MAARSTLGRDNHVEWIHVGPTEWNSCSEKDLVSSCGWEAPSPEAKPVRGKNNGD